MLALYRKEMAGFLSSLTGYVVIVIFTILNGLFLWVLPGEMNVLEGGYATLSSLFVIAPWMFLFLIPAITMRMISEERKSGTIDLLFTRPISEVQIVSAKFLAALSLAIIAMLPTLIYFLSIGLLGSPKFNVDLGATWGSYIGLVFLAAIYASIGIFSSSISENLIVAFLIAVFMCFAMYTGFDYVSRLLHNTTVGTLMLYFGIDSHYQSISRGVIDSRDIIYFISVITVFIAGASLTLKSRLWK